MSLWRSDKFLLTLSVFPWIVISVTFLILSPKGHAFYTSNDIILYPFHAASNDGSLLDSLLN